MDGDGKSGVDTPRYEFLSRVGRLINSGQSRSVLLTGDLYDLFYLENAGTGASLPEGKTGDGDYVALIEFLVAKWSVPGVIIAVYELNGPVRFTHSGDREKLRDAWLKWRTGMDGDQLAIKRMLSSRKLAAQETATEEGFESHFQDSIGNPTLALEFMRQLCLCSRAELGGQPVLEERLLFIIEGADLILPEGEITSLSDTDRHRVSICHDWFSDPGFMNADDSVILLSESRSLMNHRVARLPQMLDVSIPSPDEGTRAHFISWFGSRPAHRSRVKLWGTERELGQLTAGLSIHAIMQMLKGAVHEERILSQEDVVAKVEEYIQGQLGEDVVEFKKPSHTLENVIGYDRLKKFLRDELVPRFSSAGDDALPGAAVCGPIGSGKTYIFEAVAAELDMVVLVLKSIRSQWFGQTDVIFERLRRVLEALAKVIIFVDEADTQFGGVGPETHETERRLTGKIQAMMSDPRLRGRVVWLLMTARIHLLSPDIRRPGRTGDLIIPVLDPEGEDRKAFFRWVVEPVLKRPLTEQEFSRLDALTKDYAVASFASLRSELKAKAARLGGSLQLDQIVETVNDLLPPAITETRRYQALQALVNCTRKSLLPNPNVTQKERQAWAEEIRQLELKGVR
jgi:hypothetical protein